MDKSTTNAPAEDADVKQLKKLLDEALKQAAKIAKTKRDRNLSITITALETAQWRASKIKT